MRKDSDIRGESETPGEARARRNLIARHGSAHEVLFNLYDRMLGDVCLAEVLRDVAEVLCEDFQADRATVYVVDRQTRRLVSVAVIGNVAQRIAVPLDPTSLAGFCADSARAFAVPDAYGELSGIDPSLRFDRSWDERNGYRTHDVLCCPATFKGEVVGVVQIINSLAEPFGPADLPALSSISRLIGYAVYHAKLYEDIATLKWLEKEKAEFIRVMVHELKSPVAGAKMLLEMLGEQIGDDAGARQVHGRVCQRMDEMLELTTEMLSLARMKSGGPMSEIVELDFAAEVREVAEGYRDQAEGKGLALEIELDMNAPVRMDRKALRLAVSNLVSNAVKYTPTGRVTVRLSRRDRWAELNVSDTGMGIPEADLPNLFREFFRASNARKSSIPGTGVGLAGIKSIIERFDGQLAVDTAEGQGSTFTIRLPLAAADGNGLYVPESAVLERRATKQNGA